jgi:4-azaleucine resistance transporter AzlC
MSKLDSNPKFYYFWEGFKATLPLLIGAFPFGIIYGALASTVGLSPIQTASMSAFVFAGASQFIAVDLIENFTNGWIIVLTTFIVNLRHALYSATLAPYLKHLKHKWLIPLSFWLTDESFVVVIQKYKQGLKKPYYEWYFLGSAVFMYSNWQFATWIGIFAGTRINNPADWGLDFAMIATFIGMLIPMVKGKPTIIAVVTAAVVSLIANPLPHQLGLIVAAIVGLSAGMYANLKLATESKEAT